MESEFAAIMFQFIREGGSAAGGALAVLLPVAYFLYTGKLRPGSDVTKAEQRAESYRRELRSATRSLRAAVDAAERAARKREE